jgi:hypothetical protein
MAVLKNRAKMSTSTTGTGTITLGSAESGYQTFADAGVANADVVRYIIEDTGGAFEIGEGSYTSAGTTLSRTVSESSNSNNAINLSGSATVFIGATAEDIPALYADNPSSATTPVASGANAVSIGTGAEASAVDGIAIGKDADATGSFRSIGIGRLAQAQQNSSIALGYSVLCNAPNGNALGNSAQVFTGTGATAIGNSYSSGTEAFAAGIANNGSSYGSSGANSISIGQLAKATQANSIAIGDTATSTTANQIALGGTTDTVKISGTYTLPTADGSNGYVLTTNGSGVASWAAGGGGGADLYAANESSPSAQPSATGANAVAIGDSAVASDLDAFAGPLSRASGEYSVALGIGNSSSSYGAGGDQSISIGNQSRAMALQSAALGVGAYVDSDSREGLALGSNAFVQQCDYGTAIGAAARVHGGNSATEATAFGSSYASGTSSFAAAIANNTSSYGASGANSIAIGQTSKASSSNAIALGSSNTSSGVRSVTLGGEVNTASAENSYAFGVRSVSDKIGQYAFGCWIGQQGGMMVLKADTNDATPKAMASNNSAAGSNNQIILPNNSAYAFHGTIIARQQASGGTACAAWKVEGLIRREANAGTTVLVNSATTVLDNTPSWGMALSADTTNGGLAITVNGAASTNVKFVANITTSELTYA